jgi:hypothetical protein
MTTTAPARPRTSGWLIAIAAVLTALVYLDLWKRVVTALEDRDLLQPASSPQQQADDYARRDPD